MEGGQSGHIYRSANGNGLRRGWGGQSGHLLYRGTDGMGCRGGQSGHILYRGTNGMGCGGGGKVATFTEVLMGQVMAGVKVVTFTQVLVGKEFKVNKSTISH